MTGEMSWIKPDGTDSNGECWPTHAAVARALRCRLRPFDVYCGPYIAHKAGRLWISTPDGASGQVTLWRNGIAPAYQAPLTEDYPELHDVDQALAAAREVLRRHARLVREYARRVRALEAEGRTTSDAQGVADAEYMKRARDAK